MIYEFCYLDFFVFIFSGQNFYLLMGRLGGDAVQILLTEVQLHKNYAK